MTRARGVRRRDESAVIEALDDGFVTPAAAAWRRGRPRCARSLPSSQSRKASPAGKSVASSRTRTSAPAVHEGRIFPASFSVVIQSFASAPRPARSSLPIAMVVGEGALGDDVRAE